MAFTETESNRIQTIELKLNTIQTALNNVATKRQLKQILGLIQRQVNDIQELIDQIESDSSAAALEVHKTNSAAHSEIDSRFFKRTEFIATSSGIADAGKPVKLNADGGLDASLVSLTLENHSTLSGLDSDDHTQYLLTDGSRAMSGDLDMNTVNDINSVNAIHFNLNPTHTHTEGAVHWNDDDKTLNVDTEIADTTIQVGQEVLLRATNKSGYDILNGQVVYIDGAQGHRPTIVLADADTEETSSKTLGVVTCDIPYNSTGYVTTFGLVRDVNTEDFNEGDTLWLSSVAGAFTNIEPISPTHLVTIGKVVYKHHDEGIIFVNIINGFELLELHDVLISGIEDKNILQYDSSSSLWKNETVTDFNSTLDHGTLSGLDDDDHTQYVQHTGVPVNNQIAIWTNNRTVEGDSSLVWNGTQLDIEALDANVLINGRSSDTQGRQGTLIIAGARNAEGNAFGDILFRNYDSNGSAVDYIAAGIAAVNDGEINTGRLEFQTTATYDGLTTQMTLDASGDVTVHNGDVTAQTFFGERGMCPPALTNTEMSAIVSPEQGLMIYNTTSGVISVYDGSVWRSLILT